LDDDYYTFNSLAWSATIEKNFQLTQKIQLSLDAGALINLVLTNERKTYEEVGWPYHTRPSFSFSVCYLISRDEKSD